MADNTEEEHLDNPTNDQLGDSGKAKISRSADSCIKNFL